MIKAFIFDVFGTCVDWRASIAREVKNVLPEVDAYAFADAWRAEYQPSMARVRCGKRGFVSLSDLHFENLAKVLKEFNATVPDAAALNRAWERLDPWPDAPDGLKMLRERALIAPCSNGSVPMMARLARYADFRWDCILGAGIAQDYKPKKEVYLKSVQMLERDPSEVCMVAAHNDDLSAARKAGLKTAFVPRPSEWGVAQKTDLYPTEDWEFLADDFRDLAGRM